jgi:predicted TIM-barrel fold metal-dependent hydrolase
VNVTLGRWPFRRLPLDDTPALVAKLRQHGVTQAWAGTFDGVFHKDVTSANTWLAEECRRHGRGVLVPFGSVNPKLPDWEEELRRCAELHQMPGLRLHPNYHGYTLDDPALAQLLARAHERRLRVQIVVDLEDERMQHPLARVPHTDLKPLAARLQTLSGLRVVVLNWFRAVKSDVVKSLATAGVGFDLATVEGVGGVASLIGQISAERVLFGSNAPFFYFESAELKLTESALTPEQRRAVCSGNAQRLVARP